MNTPFLESVRLWWTGLGRGPRLGVIAGIVLVIVVGGVESWLTWSSDYVPLTGELSKDDTAAVVAQLEDIRARYRVDSSTGALLVPSGELESIRGQLAEKGWPLKAAPGFELFDNGDFGMTEFTERINYQRALEGEVARTIMSLESVRYARVHVVLPESSLLKKAAESPKASVLLVSRHGQLLSAQQISGIQHLVASAVPGLKAEDVSIHDRTGAELASGAGAALSPSSVDAGIRAQSEFEDYLSAKAEQILERIFPAGGATVSVAADLTRSRTSSVRDEILPSGQGSGAVSRFRLDTLPESLATAAPHPVHADGALEANNASPQFDVEYRVGHITEQSEAPPGAVQRISVGIVIPDLPPGVTADMVRDLVSAGIGLDAQRGDRIAVYPVAALAKPDKVPGEGGSKAEEDSPKIAFPDVAPKMNRPLWFLSVGVAFLLGVGVFWFGRSRRPNDLTVVEREQVLAQVRQWLEH